MALRLHQGGVRLLHRYGSWLLGIFWLAGLCCGAACLFQAPAVLTELLRDACGLCPELGDLLVCVWLPLLVSWLAVYLEQLWLIPGIAFCKGWLLSFGSLGVIAAYGSAGWLVRLLLLFTDILLCGLLYYYWLTRLRGVRAPSFLLIGAIGSLIGSIDHGMIAPLLQRLTDF